MVRSARAKSAAVLLTTAMLVALTGCGGGGSGGDTPSKSPSTGSGAATDTTTTAAAPDSGTAEVQIRQNWEKFFAPGTSIDAKAKLLENGEQLGPLLNSFSGDGRVGQVRAKVGQVHLTSATAAEVTYTLSLEGNDVLPNTLGTSVLQDQVWKVSVKSLCALIALDSGGTTAPGC
ncbi:hypothetical protein QMK19_15730 [Streptomyces sp. H10-C2]|uniref:hypothetical protein n=1 Tax=unclassified Streptomyces TaxID=2593676 RepID=UPI0024BBCC40|nr:MULTISPECIES: hypothetical protein [unclassified Streptomyces]MDJ0343155.1 hypothetical protein [Streptomyces sp. PH10-H1]MDJ0371097.1 hypothetical protein [Streptomyces sp. H10-C2]